MSRRSRIAEAKARIKEIKKMKKEEQALFEKRMSAESDFNKCLGDLILDTKALANYTWYPSLTKFWLSSSLMSVRDSSLVQFKDLTYSDSLYGLNASFYDGKAGLRIVDSGVDLNFSDSATMAKFIIEQNLTVDVTRLEETISKQQKDLAGYVEILESSKPEVKSPERIRFEEQARAYAASPRLRVPLRVDSD